MMFDKNIKKIRMSRGIGINELSRLTGVNASYISALERGEKANPGLEIIKKIADGLSVSMEDIFRECGYIEGNSIFDYNTESLTTNYYPHDYKKKLERKEIILIDSFSYLNDFGKDEAIKRVSELREIDKYTRNENDIEITESKFTPMTIAAHDDDLTYDEKETMDRIIQERLDKLK